MIHLVQLIVPYLLTFFFIIKGIKEPLYFLGIPFLIFMDDSVFFNKARLFHNLGSLDKEIIFIWLVMLWILSKVIRKNTQIPLFINSGKLSVTDYCIIGLSIISFSGLIMAYINYIDITNVFEEFFLQISIFASYFIIRNWTSENYPEVLVKFLFSLVVINGIACIFYLLTQGLHVIFYEGGGMIEEFQGKDIMRSFYYMPPFFFFSIAFILVFPQKKTFYSIILLIVNLLAIFLTYTRTYLLIIVLLFLLYFVLTGIKKGKIDLILKNVSIFIFGGILIFFLLSKVFPTGTEYFFGRFAELNSPQSSSVDPNNLDVRWMNYGNILSHMDEDSKIFGMGSVTQKQVPIFDDMNGTTSDMVWTGVIFRWGFVGAILFSILYITSIIRALHSYFISEGILSNLALLFLLYIFSQTIEGFVSWTFLSGHGFTIGLWYFAMLSAVLGFRKKANLAIN
jgi:hypothetical protein